jgi:outer membrane protein assembly factor BamB
MILRKQLIIAATAAAVLVFAAPSAAQISWYRAHSSGSNDGYLDVITTAPAANRYVSVRDIGTFAEGAGPVIGTDGTVYIGNEQGKVFAFQADGTLAWSREVGTGQIKASPVVTSDGSIYVITSLTIREHRANHPTRAESNLHRFLPGGGWAGPTPFPEHYGQRGWTSAPLNVWRFGNAEVLMVPAWYRDSRLSATELRLLAFSMSGALLADVVVSTFGDEITGGPSSIGARFRHGIIPELIQLPDPGVATSYQAGPPVVMVSDTRRQLVGYAFELVNGGASGKFSEMFRVKTDHATSPPVVLSDGHTVIGTRDGLVFAGPNTTSVPPVKLVKDPTGDDGVYGTPTRRADGRLVVLPLFVEKIAVLRQDAVESWIPLSNTSIASAAASRNHVFISTWEAFVTYDAGTMAEVARFPWVGFHGGRWPPVIGPKGHIYAMAGNILFVFPPRTPPRLTPGALNPN